MDSVIDFTTTRDFLFGTDARGFRYALHRETAIRVDARRLLMAKSPVHLLALTPWFTVVFPTDRTVHALRIHGSWPSERIVANLNAGATRMDITLAPEDLAHASIDIAWPEQAITTCRLIFLEPKRDRYDDTDTAVRAWAHIDRIHVADNPHRQPP